MLLLVIQCEYSYAKHVKVVMQQPLCCHLLASMRTISLLMSSIVLVMLSRCCGLLAGCFLVCQVLIGYKGWLMSIKEGAKPLVSHSQDR